MYLEHTPLAPDILCPECDGQFDVCTSHEESREECHGNVQCPICNTVFEINCNIQWWVVE